MNYHWFTKSDKDLIPLLTLISQFYVISPMSDHFEGHFVGGGGGDLD